MYPYSGPPRALQPDPAPGDLGIVQAFVNTEDLRKGTDRLRGPRGLADWLASVRLLAPDTVLGDAELETALELRRSLRRLFAAHNGGPPPRDAGETLDRAAQQGRLSVRFTAKGTPYVVATADGFAGALGRLLGFVAAAHDDGLWHRFKVCADPRCAAAFYDHSRNRAAKWCSPRCCSRNGARPPRRRR